MAALAEGTQRPLLVVCLAPPISTILPRIVLGFLGTAPEIFPAWETLPQDYSVRDAVYGGRLRVLGRLGGCRAAAGRGDHNFGPAAAGAKPAGSASRERARVRVGDSVDTEDLLRWLVDCGFERVPAIEVPGEFCLHGGIFDLFPADAEDPVRIELFGNEVESIRRFDAETQRKLEDLTEVELTVLRAGSGGSEAGKSSQKSARSGRHNRRAKAFSNRFPPRAASFCASWATCSKRRKPISGRLDDAKVCSASRRRWRGSRNFRRLTIAAIAGDSYDTTCHLRIESIERFQGPRTEALSELESLVGPR